MCSNLDYSIFARVVLFHVFTQNFSMNDQPGRNQQRTSGHVKNPDPADRAILIHDISKRSQCHFNARRFDIFIKIKSLFYKNLQNSSLYPSYPICYPLRDAHSKSVLWLFLAVACLSGNIFRSNSDMFNGPYGHTKSQETIPFYSTGAWLSRGSWSSNMCHPVYESCLQKMCPVGFEVMFQHLSSSPFLHSGGATGGGGWGGFSLPKSQTSAKIVKEKWHKVCWVYL